MRRYNPKEIEPKWQAVWADSGVYKTDMSRTDDKFFVIPMLPYPSGDLHIGHWYNFGPTDTVARFRRMLGNNVLTTIGFDAFGLPAENAAIKRGIQPAVWTYSNIESMTKQIGQIGASYDWEHSLITSKPDFYRWNQWLFLKLYEKGLAYRAKRVVNWCPKDQTVLANEQVVGDDNVCERCGTPVIQKELEQWFYKITDYAERLLDDLETVDWPPKVKTMQENWIGKSKGALIKFLVEGSEKRIEVFTTRPDTIFGATYMVLAPEHPLVSKITTDDCRPRVEQYVEETSHKTELERKEGERHKTGSFTGAYAINPATNKKIPIWIADYVLSGYGTGAIMAVPAHDERDYDFASKFDLPIEQVVAQLLSGVGENQFRTGEKVVERTVAQCIVWHPTENKLIVLEVPTHKWLTLVMGGIDEGEDWAEGAKREIIEETGYKNAEFIGFAGQELWSEFWALHKNENRIAHFRGLEFKLKDLEQADVDKSEADRHNIHWVEPDEALRRLTIEEPKYFLASILNPEGFKPFTGEGKLINSGKYDGLDSAEAREKIVADLKKEGIAKEQTNYKLRDWLISRQRYWGTPIPIIYCDKCGIQAVAEADLPVVLPEDVEFELTGRSPLNEREDFVNTKCPNCGGDAKRETDTMDTFVDSSWYFMRYIDPKNDKVAYDTELINKWLPVDHYIGGIEHAILHLMYARFITKFLHDEQGLSFEEPFKKLTNQGIIQGPDGQKMSKSRGNVVNPDEQVTSYGTDSLRLYLMFMGPYEQGGPYDMSGIAGTRRFLDRLWTLVGDFQEAEGENNHNDLEITAATHKTIKKVTHDLEELGFNTAIAAMMALVNELYKARAENAVSRSAGWRFALETLTLLLAPFAPHITEEIWEMLSHESSIHVANWPQWDEKLVAEEVITLAVQVNGKVRSEIVVTADITEEDALKSAKEDEKILAYIEGKPIKKAIYVPGRLVSLVI
ncbi:class I tRNA ligase family protein [Candidatus Saccharibacteria bacterium]|nr:class I tRNA ligase family protein [Candidatus Saccharibacteria bacterium]